jgi:hypothetical protein
VMHGRRHRTPAASVEFCDFVEHRSPPFLRVAAAGERDGKRSARCDRLPQRSRLCRGQFERMAMTRALPKPSGPRHQRGYCPFARR